MGCNGSQWFRISSCFCSGVLRIVAMAIALWMSTGNSHAEDYVSPASETSAAPPVAASLSGLPQLPVESPEYFHAAYKHALRSPLPQRIYNQGGIPRYVLQHEIYRNSDGLLGIYQPAGPVLTEENAFFQPFGTNGRSCATCHQPPSGMSISLKNIRKRAKATAGKDPLFAPVDGANCPNLVAESATSGALLGGRKGKGKRSFNESHSLLLNKGLIRVFLPVPTNAEFTLSVVTDPTTCNLDPNYNSATDGAGNPVQIVSVYRRPLIAANLAFKTGVNNVMWDGREPSLESQAVNAILGHAQALEPPSPDQVAQIVNFQKGIFIAQQYDFFARSLEGGGATGGPVALSILSPGLRSRTPFLEFTAWESTNSFSMRASVARGQAIFNTRAFTISNVAGLNDTQGNNALVGTCSSCHNMTGNGNSTFNSSQRDIGIGGHGAAFDGAPLASDLPIFMITCKEGFAPPFNASTVLTNDPGRALISGKCTDIGKRSVPALRALAAREPYFSDGSAATLEQVAEFYNKRFSIGLSLGEQDDLVNFLKAL